MAALAGCSTFETHWLEELAGDGSVREPPDAGAIDGAADSGGRPMEAGVADAGDSGAIDSGADVGTADAGDAEAGAPLQRSKQITVVSGTVVAPLADFPVLVRIIDDATLSVARDDHKDIYFTAEDGTTLLDAEIEFWDGAAGTLVAWVRIPSLPSDADTIFYLRYGDGSDHSSEFTPANVWDAEFEGVWHLSSNFDATNHARHGMDNGTADVDGPIAHARAFDGSSSYLAMGTGLLPDERYYTITAWVRPNYAGCMSTYCAVLTNLTTSSPYRGNTLYLDRSDGAVGLYDDSPLVVADPWFFSTAHMVAPDTWTFVALTTNRALNPDGDADSSINGADWNEFRSGDTTRMGNASTGQLQIGRSAVSPFHPFSGEIDEVRVSSVARSIEWIKAEYDNQKADSTFLLIESLE